MYRLHVRLSEEDEAAKLFLKFVTQAEISPVIIYVYACYISSSPIISTIRSVFTNLRNRGQPICS